MEMDIASLAMSLKEVDEELEYLTMDLFADQEDVKKKEALAKKYDKELQAKQEANAKVYKTKLETIDKKIADAINAQAKSQGYDFVFRKEVLLYGADDITESVVKVVK